MRGVRYGLETTLSELPNFAENIAMDTRFFPALVGTLALLVMFLFFDKLTEPLKNWFVPSLVAYVLGASLVGYLQTMLFIRNKGQLLSSWKFSVIVSLHIFWLACFIGYNFWRGSI